MGDDCKYLIVRPEKGGVLDLFRFWVFNNDECGAKFLESSHGGVFDAEMLGGGDDEGGGSGGGGEVTPDHRWVIVVSIIARKIIKVCGKPMEWTGYLVEFFLNLLSLNGDFMGLVYKFVQGNVVMPARNSETFISTIGHIDGRIDLCRKNLQPESEKKNWNVELGDRALMDLCMMASKLAYENAKVVKNVVDLHWQMHFVDFYNCWNDYQKDMSTQVFIACDKPEDANLILVSFRGTEPFDADDWVTDFDYSWYEIPKLGKVHMGFLEALGLGSRGKTSTFKELLQGKNVNSADLNGGFSSQSSDQDQPSDTKKELVPVMGQVSAYYAVRLKLRELLKKHVNARFVVTGHSLGGALAILLPTVLVLHEEEEIMQRLLGIYTFGQPRIGNGQICSFMQDHLERPESKYFRVVYCNDVVPRLPYDDKTFLYKHFGICLYYNSLYVEQNVDEEPNRNYFGLRYLIPEYLNAGWELLRSLAMGYVYGPDYKECWESFFLRMLGLAIPGLSAHSPVEYVNSVRLGRMRSSVEMSSL